MNIDPSGEQIESNKFSASNEEKDDIKNVHALLEIQLNHKETQIHNTLEESVEIKKPDLEKVDPNEEESKYYTELAEAAKAPNLISKTGLKVLLRGVHCALPCVFLNENFNQIGTFLAQYS